MPVAEKYLATAGVSKGEGIWTDTFFFLDPGAEIRAAISGKITRMIHGSKPFENAPAFENFFLENDGGISCSYLLLGETLVEEGAIVEQGQTIAISSGGDLGFHLGNFILWISSPESKQEGLDLLCPASPK